MMRIFFSAILAIHGIIHLIGFAKKWNLGSTERFTGKTLIPFSQNALNVLGTLWLVTCILLITTAIAYYSQKEWFWLPASVGLVLSQALIIIYWQDAKWGTLANSILLIAVVLSLAKFSFNKMVAREIKDLISASENVISINEADIRDLPPLIQTWLRKSHTIGKELPTTVHITQKGSMRTEVGGDWMSFDADEFFTINPPGFIWKASIQTDAFINIVGRDKYENGKGNMLIKAASLFTMANSSGKEIDQGTMIRYMAEMVWFPHAVVSDYLDWEQLGPNHARVTMSYGDVTASGVYTFNKEGFPIGFEAHRYREFNGTYKMEKWSVAVKSYRNLNSITIGNESEVTWKLDEGDFTWLKLVITDIKYN